MTVTPDNLTVTEGGEFLLFCDYEANPASLKEVRWYFYNIEMIFKCLQLHFHSNILFRLHEGELINLNHSRFEGGNPEQTALQIKDASRTDAGSYTCQLENNIGLGTSENDIDVEIICKCVETRNSGHRL